jgi:serine/threonine protein kinase
LTPLCRASPPSARRSCNKTADANLRPEVERLLSNHQEAGSFLSNPAVSPRAALAPARRLGPYEILSALGAGGMGEVYRARHTRLDRIVAIKVLPGHLSGNSQLHERFERKARAISSLSPASITW